jgi:hypothetical protein
MRALCLLRSPPVYRRDAVCRGLVAAGLDVVQSIDKPRPDDVVVTWNRYGAGHSEATRFERAGARAVVMENGHLGKDFAGDSWYALALGHHAGRGNWPYSSEAWTTGAATDADRHARWDDLGIKLQPWRQPGGETIVLHQRGIGEHGIASPHRWAEELTPRINGARMRVHPGSGNTTTLEHDTRNASEVITWASGAALRCLVMGIPVWYAMDGWIGAPAALPLKQRAPGVQPLRDDAARLGMLRRLAWAQWRLSEIESGHAFRTLLGV